MNRFTPFILFLSCLIGYSLFAADTTTNSAGSEKKTAAVGSEKKAAKTPLAKTVKPDTLILEARLVEIPGTFAPNDLYDYVYIMKYKIVKVVKGKCASKEILVGHYDPLIPRSQVKGKMAGLVSGNLAKFEEGQVHRLTLIQPISLVWHDAIQDDYFDSELVKYYALKADLLK